MKNQNSDKKNHKKSVVFCPKAEISSVIASSESEDLQKQASQMTSEQLDAVITALKNDAEPDWQEKFKAFFKGLENVESLELIGNSINFAQFLTLIDFVPGDPNHAWKLVPLFVALPHQLFNQLLSNMSEERKQNLHYLCATEPLRHHLVSFVHEMKSYFDESEVQFLQLQQEIRDLNVISLRSQDLAALQSRIVNFRHVTQEICLKIENALLLAWNADSKDIIEMLSTYRERYERYLFSVIGHPGKTPSESLGLFRELEDKLATVFAGGSNGSPFEALDDNDAAIDALPLFSIWYAGDYWKLGLLPGVADPTQLTPQLTCNADTMAQYRHQAEKSLSRIGLNTVKDLKDNHIVSRALLSDYIKHKARQLPTAPPIGK